ncbi:MAG TPA: tRNA-dependent cyclodipeptide synthase [Kofleriaceae bacterium]|jgi:tRNA-dependent cyclodipeptide synthase|nr:tRNA-dependent cyclodipeptide synthase [Kofleriaceae bacterium]
MLTISTATTPPRPCPPIEAANVDRPLWQQIAWDQLELEELAAIQRQVRAVIDAKRKLAGKQRQLERGAGMKRRLPEPLYAGRSGYRALISQVAPAHLRASVDKLERCMLGVSLGGSNALDFHGAKLEATVRWIAARATHCCVLVGDSLGRISLEVREGLAPEVAKREACALGRRYAAETEAVFRHYTTEDVGFEIRYGTEYTAHKSFRPYLDEVHRLYQADAAFRALVHSFGGEYLVRTGRSLGGGGASPSERWKHLAHEYLLEELALFACLAEDGWPVLVYPGSIDSIIEVAEGRHPSLPAPLGALGFIALWLDAKSGGR